MCKKSRKSIFSLLGALLVLLIAISFSACDITSELPDEKPIADNPNDPESQNYELPDIQLVNLPGNHFIIEDTDFELHWEPVIQVDNLRYRYKIASPESTLDAVEYSEYQTDTFASLANHNLEETLTNEAYEFVIEISSDSRPDLNKEFEGSFEVDALQGRGFLFRPQTINMNTDGFYTAYIYIDEIEEQDDLTAFKLAIDFDGNAINIAPEDILVYEDDRSFLYRHDGDIISFSKVENNTIIIEAGVAGNNLEPLSGGGAICEINFTPRFGFSSSSMSVSRSSVFKTSEGSDIEVSAFDEALILQ